MAKELSLSFVIGAALAGSFNSVMTTSVAKLDRLGEAIKGAKANASQLASYSRLTAQIDKTGAALGEAQAGLQRVREQMAGADQPTSALRKQQEAAEKAVERLTRQLDSQQRRLQLQRKALDDAGISTADLASEEHRLGQTVTQLTAKYERLGAAMAKRDAILEKRQQLRGQLFDAVAMGAVIGAPIAAAVEFESVMADVKKVVNFDTPEQFGAMQKDVLRLSTTIPMAASGIGEIVAAAGQAGIARQELVRFAEDAAKMGVAFDLSGAEAGSAMTGMRSVFALNQDGVVSLGDAYNHLSNNMDATAAGMLDIANRAGSNAKLFGLTGEQVGALGASFLALKTPPEVAATGINALLSKLATADRQGAKFQQALNGIGMDATSLKAAIKDDAQGALLSFFEAIQGSDDVMGTLSDLFGAEYADDMAKIVGSLDTYRKAIGLVGDKTAYAGSMQREYEERSATTANSIQLMKNQINRLGVTIGSVLLPPFNLVLGAIGTMAGWVATLAERFPLVTKVVVGFSMGLMALRVAWIAARFAMTFFTAPFAALRVAILAHGVAATTATTATNAFSLATLRAGAATKAAAIGSTLTAARTAMLSFASTAVPAVIAGIRGIGIALMTTPIGWIIGGIAAAAFLVFKFWKPIKAFFSGMWDGFKEGAAPLMPIFSGIGSALGAVWKAVKTAFGWFMSLLAPVDASAETLGEVAGAGASVGRILGAAFNALTAPIRAVVWLVGRLWDGLTMLFSWSPVGLVAEHWSGITDVVGGIFDGVIDTVRSAFDWIAGKFQWLSDAAASVGSWFGIESEQAGPGIQPVSAGPLAAKPLSSYENIPALRDIEALPLPGSQSAAVVTNQNSYSISVTAAPGESPEAFAERVARLLREQDRQRQRAALYDGVPAYG